MAPNYFGSRAVKVLRTPLDKKLPKGWMTCLLACLSSPTFADIPAVNRWVNSYVEYRRDTVDFWQYPESTLLLRSGDCEDIALLKRELILRNGLARTEDVYLVVGWDRLLHEDHAMLVVRADSFLVLDNFHNAVRLDRDYRDFRPVFSFAGDNRWLHGTSAR